MGERSSYYSLRNLLSHHGPCPFSRTHKHRWRLASFWTNGKQLSYIVVAGGQKNKTKLNYPDIDHWQNIEGGGVLHFCSRRYPRKHNLTKNSESHDRWCLGVDIVLILILKHSQHSVKDQSCAGVDDLDVDQLIEIHLPTKRAIHLDLDMHRELHVLAVHEAKVRRDNVHLVGGELRRGQMPDGHHPLPLTVLRHLQLDEIFVWRLHSEDEGFLSDEGQMSVECHVKTQEVVVFEAEDVDRITRQILIEETQRLLRGSLMERQRRIARSEEALHTGLRRHADIQNQPPGKRRVLMNIFPRISVVPLRLHSTEAVS